MTYISFSAIVRYMNQEKNTNLLIHKDNKAETVRPKYNLDKIKKAGMLALMLLMFGKTADMAATDYHDERYIHPNVVATENFTFHGNNNDILDLSNEMHTVVGEMATENNIDFVKNASYSDIFSSHFKQSVREVHPDGQFQQGDEFSVQLVKLHDNDEKYTSIIQEVTPEK